MPVARMTGTARISKLLVVDASVVAAAGGEKATDPVPAHARDALKAILTICHRVYLSVELRQEWRNHRSWFAQRWWRQMYARRKIVDRAPPSCAAILEDIRSFPSITQSDVDAVAKDIHLIAAALAADHAILSWDNRVAAAIRKVCADTGTMTSKTVAHVLWINPISDRDALHAWLSETGPVQPNWRLGGALPAPATRRSGRRPTQRAKP
jgi:hypothetical protein